MTAITTSKCWATTNNPHYRCPAKRYNLWSVSHTAAARASCQIRKIAGAHVPGMPETFSPPPRVSDPDMHHGTCVTHVPWCMPGSLTSGFLWSRRRGKGSRHFRRMRNPQFHVSGKRPMGIDIRVTIYFRILPLLEWRIECCCSETYQIRLWITKCDNRFCSEL